MLTNQANLKIGQKVHYQPDHYKEEDKYENGMIKEIPDHTTTSVRVVYNCLGDWDNFEKYTGALTSMSDLNDGWRHD